MILLSREKICNRYVCISGFVVDIQVISKCLAYYVRKHYKVAINSDLYLF